MGVHYEWSKGLSGEIFAKNYVNNEKEPADAHEMGRYIKSRKRLIALRERNKGILGVSCYIAGVSPLYNCFLPGKKNAIRFRSPVQAASFYNQYVGDKYGRIAVKCDVMAVVKEYLYELTA